MEIKKESSPSSATTTQEPLNVDILISVFQYLSTQDLRNTKLVCKAWYRASYSKKVAVKEAIYFPTFYDMPSIVKVLTGVFHPKLNIKFDYHQFTSDFYSFLENFGDRIVSLHFYDCIFDRDMLPQIFIHCINLEELCFFGKCHTSRSHHRFISLFQSEVNLQEEVNVHLEKLTTLNLYDLYPKLNETDLCFIGSTCPNLKIFKLNMRESFFGSMFLFEFLSKALLQVETVHVRCDNIVRSPLEVCYNKLSQIDLSRLRNVGTTLHLDREILYKISFCKSLRSVNAVSRELMGYLDTTVLADFLIEHTEIEHLSFVWHLSLFCCVTDFGQLFMALVTSRLKSLKIVFHVDRYIDRQFDLKPMLTEVALTMTALSSNFTLHYLDLDVAGLTQIKDLFFQHFPKIRRLNLSGEPDIALRNQIKSTWFTTEDVTSPVPLRTTDSLKRRVQSLELIRIHQPSTLQTYQFPSLKCLFIDDSNSFRSKNFTRGEQINKDLVGNHRISKIFIERLCATLILVRKESPKLEAVEYHCLGACLEVDVLLTFLRNCLNFQHIRYISLRFNTIVGKFDQLKLEIFNYCKQYVSIRCIWLIILETQHIFYLNKITGEFHYKLIEDGNSIDDNGRLESRLKNLCGY